MRNAIFVPAARVALVLLLVTVGCTSDRRAPRIDGTRGGTLRLLAASDTDSLDTAIAYYTSGWAFERAYARTLYGYDTSAPPEQVTVPVPDVASGPPTITPDRRTYTFRLRSGVRYAPPVDREVAAQDFITAVERLYDRENPSGGQLYGNLIAGARDFGDKKTETITGMRAIDRHTLKVTLVKPAGDFLSVLAMPFFAPVPGEYARRYQVGANYSGYVVGSGPYTLDRYVPGRSIAFARNPNWDPATDPLRKAWVDRIEVLEGFNPAAIQQAIQRGAADLSFDTQPSEAQLRSLTRDPDLSKRLLSVTSDCVIYLALGTNPAAGRVADVRVRRAINYAIDKVAVRRALGSHAGTIASTILPATSAAYRPYNLYWTPGHRGDPEKAKELLTAAGHPDGLTLNYVGMSTGESVPLRRAIEHSLARAGIRLRVKAYNLGDLYTKSLQLPAKRLEHQIGQAYWCPDWPGDNGRPMIVPLLDGRSIQPSGTSNYGEYDNPTVNRLIDQALAEGDRQRRLRLWGDIDRRIMLDAPWVPLTNVRLVFTWSARVHALTYNPWTTTPDLTALWLDPPRP
jgi:peptide/nickel transport system substrate-binding protein